ncbi:hypothetical protein EV361DRAFT_567019 [Lentinula raphanica]|nr:hypothetical protein EV361DRAFT_567019 [Lentinula raphanica]
MRRPDGRSQTSDIPPRSSLFGRDTRHGSPVSSNSRTTAHNLSAHRWVPRRFDEISNDDPQRLRPRPFASTRPSASNSLVAENAAEFRRQNARADLMEHLFNDETSRNSTQTMPRGRGIDSRRSAFGIPGEIFTNQSSFSYHHRSPSPHDYIRSSSDVRDAAERELEEQERRRREERTDSSIRRSTSSWLPPPQFGTDRSLAESLTNHEIPSDMDSAISSTGRNRPLSELDWLRRRRTTRRALYPDEPPSEEMSQTFPEFERHRPAMPLPRPHISGPSWTSPSAEAENDSSGFFDSQHSSITDMARTINGRSQGSTDPDYRTSPHLDVNDTNNSHRPVRAASGTNRRFNPPAPSIPPPDLGFLFPPNDLPTDSFGITSILPTANEPSGVHSGSRYVLSRGSESYDSGNTTSPSAPHPSIDVDSFAPGPFRSTMQRLFRSATQEAPSIPPLNFEQDPTSLSEARSYARANGTAEQDYPPRRSVSTSTRETRLPLPERPPWNSRSSYLNRSSYRPSSRPGEDIHVHETLNRRSRPDGSSNNNPASEYLSSEDSFRHAIEILRQDGLPEQRSHQFTNRYRQRRDAFPTSASWADSDSDNTGPTFHRYAPWSMHGDVSSANPTPSSSSAHTTTNTRMGNAATRRRPSPARNLDRPEGLPESRLNRNRTSSRFGRHRTSDIDREFGVLSDLVGRNRRFRGNFNLGDYMVSCTNSLRWRWSLSCFFLL